MLYFFVFIRQKLDAWLRKYMLDFSLIVTARLLSFQTQPIYLLQTKLTDIYHTVHADNMAASR